MEEKEYIFVDGATGGGDRHVNKPTPSQRRISTQSIETPIGLRRLGEDKDRDFSGFREERGNMRRIMSLEKEMRCMRKLMSSILEKQEVLQKENNDLKDKISKCEQVREVNQEMKEAVDELRRENDGLKKKCDEYKETLQGLQEKVNEGTDKVESGLGAIKLEEWKNAWKKEQDEEKVKFTEVVKKQIQEKTKDTVIKVFKEKGFGEGYSGQEEMHANFWTTRKEKH